MENFKIDNKLLMDLLNAYGVSGREQDVRGIIQREMKKYVNKTYVDKVGNLICMKKGKRPKIMIAAHMDEIGLMVKSVEKDGLISIAELGDFETVSLIGQRVNIPTNQKKAIHGVITTKDISCDEKVEKIPTEEEMVIDTGLSKKELERLGISVGTYLNFERKAMHLGNEEIISGKALDDRLGCFILIELAKRLKKVKQEIYFVFTVQEEVGLYGARTSAYTLEPDWAIAVDVTEATDFGKMETKKIGEGPTITVKDTDMIGNECINDWLKEIAKKRKIPLQLDVSDKGTTDALSISISKGGVPSTVLGVCIRNIHTTIGIAHKRDVIGAVRILETLLKKPPVVCVI